MCLACDSSIVSSKDFEIGVIKLQKGQEPTAREKLMLSSFRVSEDDENSPNNQVMSNEE